MSFKIPQKIEILSINLTKYVQDLYNKNYTILIKGMERHTMFMDWQTQYGKDHFPNKIDIQINTGPIKITARYFNRSK